MENTDDVGIRCNEHPDAPHGFMRDASHSAGRYVCECESWEPPKNKPEQKPVGYVAGVYDGYCVIQPIDPAVVLPAGMALYRAPTGWVGLTDEEIKEIVGPWGDTPIKGYTRKLFDQIEAKLKEKNT